jgi:hypothetical protein
MTQQYRIVADGSTLEKTLRDKFPLSREVAIHRALGIIRQIRPFDDDDAFNEYVVLQLEKGEPVCGIRLVPE